MASSSICALCESAESLAVVIGVTVAVELDLLLALVLLPAAAAPTLLFGPLPAAAGVAVVTAAVRRCTLWTRKAPRQRCDDSWSEENMRLAARRCARCRSLCSACVSRTHTGFIGPPDLLQSLRL